MKRLQQHTEDASESTKKPRATSVVPTHLLRVNDRHRQFGNELVTLIEQHGAESVKLVHQREQLSFFVRPMQQQPVGTTALMRAAASSVRHLDVTSVCIPHILCMCSALQTLCVSYTHLTIDDLHHLGLGLLGLPYNGGTTNFMPLAASNHQLTHLTLRGMSMFDDEAATLCLYLPRLAALTHLALQLEITIELGINQDDLPSILGQCSDLTDFTLDCYSETQMLNAMEGCVQHPHLERITLIVHQHLSENSVEALNTVIARSPPRHVTLAALSVGALVHVQVLCVRRLTFAAGCVRTTSFALSDTRFTEDVRIEIYVPLFVSDGHRASLFSSDTHNLAQAATFSVQQNPNMRCCTPVVDLCAVAADWPLRLYQTDYGVVSCRASFRTLGPKIFKLLLHGEADFPDETLVAKIALCVNLKSVRLAIGIRSQHVEDIVKILPLDIEDVSMYEFNISERCYAVLTEHLPKWRALHTLQMEKCHRGRQDNHVALAHALTLCPALRTLKILLSSSSFLVQTALAPVLHLMPVLEHLDVSDVNTFRCKSHWGSILDAASKCIHLHTVIIDSMPEVQHRCEMLDMLQPVRLNESRRHLQWSRRCSRQRAVVNNLLSGFLLGLMRLMDDMKSVPCADSEMIEETLTSLHIYLHVE